MRPLYILLFAFGMKAFAQLPEGVYKKQIDSLILTGMRETKAVGVAVGIVKDGKIVYQQGYGTKKLNTIQPVDSLTNFHLASISKVFVATAIMQLVEKGKLKLEDKLLRYITVTELKDQRFKEVTIEQMLNHTSGFPDVNSYHWAHPKNDSLALGEYAKKCIAKKNLLFNPGSKFQYSNMAFEVLGHVIEIVSGKYFDAYEYEQVLSKSGLQHSNFDYAKIDAARRSSPHVKLFSKVRVSGTYPYNREHGPSSTLNSCTQDMCLWIQELLKIHAGTSTTGLLTKETLLDMWSPKYNFASEDYIGWSWFVHKGPLGLCANHDGGDLGYCSALRIYPEKKMGIIVLINGEYASGMLGVVEHIAYLLENAIKKIPDAQLKLLEGEYLASNAPKGKWKIQFKLVNGELLGKDGSYQYKLLPVGDNTFINPDDGATFVFDTKDINSIRMTFFGKYQFDKLK